MTAIRRRIPASEARRQPWLAGAPIVPVAHNAGRVWPRNAFLKHPGTVTVRIGPPIDTVNRDAKTLNALVETWIEEQQKALS